MSIVETPAPPTLETRIECDVAPNMIRSENNFFMGLEVKFTVEFTKVNQKQVEDPKYLFTDNEFPPDDRSLVFRNPAPAGVVWKRPHEFVEKAKLVQDGFGKNDVAQGDLGDCYFLAAAAALATTPKLLTKLIPSNQKLNKDGKAPDYNGMLQFRFWRFGRWVEVVVDDYLPTMAGYGLIYGRSTDPKEFWVSLAEKAYAKINGSYQALNGGQNTETLEDMTGGLAIQYPINKSDRNTVYKRIASARRHRSFVCASLFAFGMKAKEVEGKGLVANHAYTITGNAIVKLSTGVSVKILRVRNPWGTNLEWTGSFSDKSEIWKKVDDATKRALDFQVKGDSEWWMSLDDFWANFSSITICTLGPDFNEDGDLSHASWHLSTVRGQWLEGKSAGGSRNNPSFDTNPQFLMQVLQPDDPVDEETEEGEEDVSKMSYVQVGLMQEHRRVDKKTVVPTYGIGMTIFKLNAKRDTKLNATEVLTIPAAAENRSFVQTREVTLTASVEPGYYVIVPATFSAGKSSSFFLRVFTEKPIQLTELKG